ncbi:hypothetical protein CHS0354_001186 [Potamilus streckersoni]|uniref:Ig-like domain-containing protein n=1 Tax=Potamilus streckersoni TaxID=2493646 RepID=A0AAE0T703_9BIVA|nr:hypothetical protein CHS0354_001186 [Potamilus streckersoni]
MLGTGKHFKMSFTVQVILLILSTLLASLPGLQCSRDSHPVMDITPLNVTVHAGTAIILPCIVNTISRGEKKHNVIWVNSRRQVITKGESRITTDRRFSVSRLYDHDWNLHVSNVRPEDAGLYMCQVNTEPIQIKRVHLHVQVPPVISKSDDIVTPEGNNPVLFCNASGEPKPSVMWFKGGEQIISDGEMLRFVNITREQRGKYRCLAFNRVEPNAEEYINVEVQYRPEVRLLNHRIRQYQGKSVFLDCIVKAEPHGTVRWTKNDLPLPDEKWKYGTTMFDGDDDMITLQLRITLLEKSDFGFYTCEASNIMGKSQVTMDLLELESTTSKPEAFRTKSQLSVTPFVPFLGHSRTDSNLETILDTGGFSEEKDIPYNPKGPTIYRNEILILQETGSSQEANTVNRVITATKNGGTKLQTSNTGLLCIMFVMVNKVNFLSWDFL